jgi:chromosome segregation ATPase
MDPFSVTGSAVGIVSLGLTLCKGLTEYLGALKCRKEDIESASSQVESLRVAFAAIETALPKLTADSQGSVDAVRSCLQSCEAEISKFNDLLDDLKRETTSTNSVANKIRQQGQKLSYPFRQSNLHRIEEKVQSLNAILLTGLQAIVL